jgi:hypothetical protein
MLNFKMEEDFDNSLSGVTVNFDQLKQLKAFETGELKF